MKKRSQRRGYNRRDNGQIEFSNHILILYRKGPVKLYALKGFPEILTERKENEPHYLCKV